MGNGCIGVNLPEPSLAHWSHDRGARFIPETLNQHFLDTIVQFESAVLQETLFRENIFLSQSINEGCLVQGPRQPEYLRLLESGRKVPLTGCSVN